MAKLGQVQNYNKALEDGLGFSAVVHAGGLLHLAGIISTDDAGQIVGAGDMAAQIDRIYDIMEATLAKNGATLEHVVNEVMYVTDMPALMAAAAVRVARYEGHAYPAATAVQVVGLAFPEALVEIQVTAQLDAGEWSPNVPPAGSPV